MNDGLDRIRAQWAKEKAAGFWEADYLAKERQMRRAWIEEQLALQAEKERAAFLVKHAGRTEL